MEINSNLIKAVEELIQKKSALTQLSKAELYERTQKLISFFELLLILDQNNPDHINKN